MRSQRQRERGGEREREIQISKNFVRALFKFAEAASIVAKTEYHLHRHCSTAVHYQLMLLQVS
jgi:hypothetical protein